MVDRYAVIGNPIEHSKSPTIHAMFAAQTGQAMEYGRILGDRQNFPAEVEQFRAVGGCGLNVTVPFKEQAFSLAGELTARARSAGAVNTLWWDSERIYGDNTDGAGLVRDLGCNHRFDFAGARVLLLGAGGAARGVLLPLLEQRPRSLLIANRTADKARQLAAAVAAHGSVEGCGYAELAERQFDLIINATAAGLSGQLPPIPDDCLEKGGWVYDMMYGDQPTGFVLWGRQRNAGKALDGLGMLVEQAAESFSLWRKVMPDTEAVIEALRVP